MITTMTRSPLRKGLAVGQSGQSIVEFAFVSLLLVMMTFGIIDLGRAVFARAMLTNAVREAARYGIVGERSATTIPADGTSGAAATTSTSCAAATYCGRVVAAAQRASPSLGLTTLNFTDSATTPPTRRIACSAWPSTPAGTWWDSSTGGSLFACRSAQTDARLTVCAEYQFGLTAPRLVGFNSIRMRECARATLQ